VAIFFDPVKPNHGGEDTSVRVMKKRLFFNND